MSGKKGYLGVDLGGTNVRAALLNEEGGFIARQAIKHGTDKSPAAIFQNIKTVITDVLNQDDCQGYSVRSLGIGVPGSVDSKTSIIVKAPNLGWEKVDLIGMLEKEYSFPVCLANDITMAVWGEYSFGGGSNFQDLVFIALGTGVGGGFILDGKVLSSKAESGVEVGHMIVEPNGAACGCGNRGCWETIVSGSHLQRAARSGLRQHPDSLLKTLAKGNEDEIKIAMIYEASKQKDPLAVNLWDRFIHYLALGINNIVVIFNPQALILGGGVVAGLPGLVDELRVVLKKTIKIFDFDTRKIMVSQLGEDAGLIGAAFYGQKPGDN